MRESLWSWAILNNRPRLALIIRWTYRLPEVLRTDLAVWTKRWQAAQEMLRSEARKERSHG